jgi:HAD superfamily hydrolase (TIGR01509 family)
MKVVIFDMDGVLADTHKLIKEANSPFYQKYGIPEEMRKELHGLPFEEKIRRINKKLNKNIDPVEASKLTYQRLLEVSVTARPLPGAVELVRALKQRGTPIAVASAGNRSYCASVLGAIGLDNDFSIILAKEDVPNPKPAPDIYLHIAKHFNVKPEECTVIDDSPHCLATARGIGMKTIGVLCSLTRRDELAPLADKVVDNLGQLTPDEL